MAFSTQNSLFKIDICRAFEKEKKKVRRYICASLRMYQDQVSLLTNYS